MTSAILYPQGICGNAFIAQASLMGYSNGADQANTPITGTLQYVAGFVESGTTVTPGEAVPTVCGEFPSNAQPSFNCNSTELPVVECGQLQLYLD